MFVHFCRSVIQTIRSHQVKTVKSCKNICYVFVSHQSDTDCRNLKGEPPQRGVPQGCGLGLAVITHIRG